VRTEKGRSNSSSAAFCYYLELGKKVRANFGRKCSKDKKYWDFSCIDRNTRVAPLQANLPDIVIRRQLLSRRYGYKRVKDRIYKGVIDDNICQVKGFLAIQPE